MRSNMQITAGLETDQNHAFDLKEIGHSTAKRLHSSSFLLITEHKVPFRRPKRDQKVKQNIGNCTIATNGRSCVGQSTAFYKDLSILKFYLKDVNNQQCNQSHHDTRSWYHRMAASMECLQATSLQSGSLGACLQATKNSETTTEYKMLSI